MIITNCPKCGSMNITTAGVCANCGWSQFAQVTTVSTRITGEIEIMLSGKALLDDYKRLLFENRNLTARIAELEAAQRWIPVSERLPEDRVTILAAFNNREILTAKYYKYYEGFGSVENYWRIEGWHSGNVTHWMPLPQPPIVYGKECEE